LPVPPSPAPRRCGPDAPGTTPAALWPLPPPSSTGGLASAGLASCHSHHRRHSHRSRHHCSVSHLWPPQLRTTEVAPTTKNHGGPLLGPSADPYCHPHQDMTRGAPAPPLKPFSRRSCLLRRHLPARATTMLDQRLCAICSPSVQPAAPRHASRGRSGVLEPVASGAGAQLPARPSGAHTSIAIYRCEVADCGTRPTDSDQKTKTGVTDGLRVC
jgi:hypothetical protein